MMIIRLMRVAACALATLAIASAPTSAQGQGSLIQSGSCPDSWSDGTERFCETRAMTLPAPNGALTIDGGQNGGISVVGGDVSDVRVEARVQATTESLAKQVRIVTDGGAIHATGPTVGDGRSWSVSYRVTVPRRTNLDLRAYNGGIGIKDVTGQLRFRAENGGVRLADVSGDVRGETRNGGVNVDLSGSRYQGAGLNVTTTNGGVLLKFPRNYSARVETGTVNGHISTDIPFTIQGEDTGRSMSTTLGAGGALIHVTTRNGGVTVQRAS